MVKKKQIPFKVVTHYEKEYLCDSFPMDFVDFEEFIREIFVGIPTECLSTTKVHINHRETYYNDDDHNIVLQITYHLPLTTDEINKLKKKEREEKKTTEHRQRQLDLAQFNALKKKLGL